MNPMTDRVEIVSTPLDVAMAVAVVGALEAGGIDVFLGTTRAETRADGVPLVALDYEAYAEMAVAEMRKLVASARERWPVVRACVLHRVGRVSVGEASVLIAVACPHRGQAFDACRFLIDELKKSVPIWKKEVWADASTTWKETDATTQ
jgi:molybdopterin synthase catalytic subunit